MEQVFEWNSNSHLCFVDYEKAFDNVERETLQMIIESYGIAPNLWKCSKECTITINVRYPMTQSNWLVLFEARREAGLQHVEVFFLLFDGMDQ